MKNFGWRGVAVIVGVFYLLVRLWRLDDSCLWFDEIFGVHAAGMEWGAMFSFLALDLIHPPLFYVLLKIWISAGSESLLWLRLFSVFWSVLAIAPLVLLCRELKLKTLEILTALLLVAVNGALIRYAQEVRMYSLLFCFGLFSLWLFVRFLRDDSKSVLLALFFFNLLTVYTHYFGWLLVATECLYILFFQREQTRRFFIWVGILILAFAPWAWMIWRASETTGGGLAQNIGWQAKPTLLTLLQFPLVLIEPFHYPQSNIDSNNIWLVAAPLALLVFGAIGFYFFSQKNGETDFARLLSFFIVAPIIIAFIASWIAPYSIWGTRHLIIVFAPAAILAAIAIWRLPRVELRYSAVGFAGLLILLGGLIYFLRKPPVFIWCGWSELAAQVEATQPAERTVVYVFEDDGAYHLWYALRRNPRFTIVSVDGYADMPEDKAYFLPRGFDEVKIADKNAIAGDKFWLAFRDAKWNSNKQILQDLSARGYKIGEPLTYRAQGVTIFLISVKKTQ